MSKTPLALLVLFFCSGACSLVYQVVWVRMLMPVFGVSTFAISIVLAAFMAGLALGSYWCGRVADRRGNGLRIYALLELGIGVFALIFPLLLAGLDEVYTALYGSLQGIDGAFVLVRLVLAFALLLVPTTLMGATLPTLSKAVAHRLERVGGDMGRLYAANTLGAATGCAVAAFFALEYLGVSGTTYAAAAGNLIIALIAYRWSRDGQQEQTGVVRDEVPTTLEGRLVLGGFALSGFVALGYEVLWTRLLAMLLQSATAQSLSTILVAFLLGLAGGAALGARLIDRWRTPLAAFGAVELLIGLCGLSSIAAFGSIPYIVEAWGGALSWEGHLSKLFVAAFVVMLPATLLMGLLFPIAAKVCIPRIEQLGRGVGTVYAANTLGAIAGALVAGFVLLPLLGTYRSIQVLAWVNIAIGAVILALDPAAQLRRKAVRTVGGLALGLVLMLLLPAGLFVELFHWSEPNSRLLYWDEGAGATVSVHQKQDGVRILKVNGGGEVPTDYASLQTFRLLGHLPLVLHPDPAEVLVIAFGGGITLSAAELHQPERLDCAELVPGVPRAAPYFARHNRQIATRLDQAPIELVAEDGRNHVLRTQRQYDAIICDATHPGTADSWVLYTEEFYRLCRGRVGPDGLVAQWLPLHGLSVEDYKMILRTFRAVYPHASLWLTHQYSILLGTPGALRIGYAALERKLGQPEVRANLRSVDLGDSPSFLSALVLGEKELAAYAGSGPINTDDRPYISFTDRRRRGTSGGLPVLKSLVEHLVVNPRLYLSADIPTEVVEALERRLAARRHTVLGTIALLEKDGERAAADFARAREIDPGERGALRGLKQLRGRSTAP
ncbi:MAG: hypothetical protein F4Z57_11885 [Gemmatimonadetes bacterium]|nr:hypothetical protein [Gemmatimonadota bacterium]MYC73265.1 hypothetical protein [Gemmatimonadota bacterium]MYI63563.1 hypothetical protein [Gemmatimonadota bacterium]